MVSLEVMKILYVWLQIYMYKRLLITILKNMLDKKPSSKYKSPLEKGYHPGLDTTEILDEDGMQKYQSHVGLL